MTDTLADRQQADRSGLTGSKLTDKLADLRPKTKLKAKRDVSLLIVEVTTIVTPRLSQYDMELLISMIGYTNFFYKHILFWG